MLGSFLKAVAGVALTPVAVIKDVATVGGLSTNKDRTYTGEALSDVFKNLDNVTKPSR